MRTSIISFVLAFFILSLSPISALADNDNSQKLIKFELKIKPNQQYAQIKLDGDDHRQIQLKAEYIKLNTVTNNHHIKITITNNSGQTLLHQLFLIDKVEHSEVKYPDSTTDYIKNDDGKQITKTLPYYNYGNIKPAQATLREWYLSNTGKDEIEVKGYIVSKEIPVVLDPKIAAANPKIAELLVAFITAMRDNDLNGILAVVATKDITYRDEDLHRYYRDVAIKYPGAFPKTAIFYSQTTSVNIYPDICYVNFNWIDSEDGLTYLGSLELQYMNNKWWITDN